MPGLLHKNVLEAAELDRKPIPWCVQADATPGSAGRLAQVKVWKREFAAQNRIAYVRTPDSVTVSATEPVAMELGQWDGAPMASGTYAAKWREVAGAWVIEAEVFVTLG